MLDFDEMKPVLFFDFDNTLIDVRHVLARFLKDHYDFEIDLGTFIDGSNLPILINERLPDEDKIDEHAFYRHCSMHFTGSIEWHTDCEPIPGAVETLQLLKNQYELWIVTARDLATKPVVDYILEKNFPGLFSGAHFVWQFDDDQQRFVGVPKKDFIMDFDLRRAKIAFFDDSPGEILATQNHLPAYLFDPHNHHPDYVSQGIRNLVKSWDEIKNLILQS